MNRHQVLTGACNAGDQCYAVGSVEGIHFTAYAAGCDIVILASDFQRVQIIPGVTHGNVKVSCVDCSTDTGKIAASYQNKVYIFEPTPLLHHESSHKLDYRWYQTATFEADCYINCVSWNMEGSKILTGGEVLQIWSHSQESNDQDGGPGGKSVRFHVGGTEEDGSDSGHKNHTHHNDIDKMETMWECVWRCRPATPVYHLKYSPDGLLFASAGKTDRLVKIWYEDRKLHLPLTKADSIVSPKKEELHFSFVYIAHPRAVTGFSWRKTSKYMPRGSVANMLVTSCIDNVCRLWCETILPDDGLIDLEQFDPNASSMDPKFHTHRHKKRFMQRLKTIRSTVKNAVNDYRIQRQWFQTSDSDPLESQSVDSVPRHAIHKRKRHHKFGPETVMSMPNFNSIQSVHDFHKFAIHHSGVAPALHFHLAASINPETDIPLLPVVGAKGDQKFNFQLHWLNNKELQFTMEAEIILQDLHRGTLSSAGDHVHDIPHCDTHDASDSDHGGHEGAHDESEVDGQHRKKKNKLFKKRHKHHHHSKQLTKDVLGHHKDSSNSIGSEHSDHTSEGTGGSSYTSPEVPGSVIDALDRKIEILLRDWHQNADMMFSIHPVDGSYLVWLVDWLDEYNPYCFRQAQVSFSSRLPHAFPVPDARTMASNLLMYCNYSKMDIKSAMKMSENRANEGLKVQNQPAPATGKSSPGQNDNMLIPNVLLITKHLNGSLNQWQVTFADMSKFSTVVSVAHASRACGHRFRTNSATCHPKLPLLLTTSHHNVPKDSSRNSPISQSTQNLSNTNQDYCDNLIGEPGQLNGDCNDEKSENNGIDHENLVGGVEFCSELILWRVDPVGPLSKSGGIVELARINSPHLSAFANVAWVPTLLPSSTLGSYSNSPSALFVASDGSSLRMYQAVIDARTILLEMGSQKKEQGASFCSTTSSGYSMETQKPASELFNIVSLQSSARPGCIIELEAIADAQQNWQQTQLLHVFQEQLITGKPGSGPESMEAIVDLRNSCSFSEHFYLVVLEKAKDHGSMLHMWKITISSQPGTLVEHNEGLTDTSKSYAPDVHVIEDDGSNPPSRSGTPDHLCHKPTAVVKLSFSTTKVCTQKLSLPEGVDVLCATVSAGHLSSASIYPACLAPYVLVTACSDGDVRFWRCDMLSVEEVDQSGLHCDLSLCTTSFEMAVEEEDGIRRQSTVVFTKSETVNTNYDWEEWKMLNETDNSSAINVPGHPITVSCAYSGRVAVAYRLFGVRPMPDNPASKLVNLWVAIYECESTGGSEWLLEDTIELKNVNIPDPKAEIDLNCIFSPDGISSRPPSDEIGTARPISPSASLVNINRTKSVPSLSTICSVRKCISEIGNKSGVLQQKHLVELDWVSTEDGSHVLTVGVGSKVLMYAQVSNDIVSASKQAAADNEEQDHRFSINKTLSKGALNLHLGGERSQTAAKNKAMLQHRSKSMVLDDTPEQIQWMKLRSVELTTADGLPPLPMHISWVRAGILVVGMDNEMHVYSQWRNSSTSCEHCGSDDRDFDDTSLSSALPNLKSASTMKPSYSMPSFKHLNTLMKKSQDFNFGLNRAKSESMSSLSAIHEYGLFEAAHEANPVLPQYHPKKLMELLNFGKIRRVKAILCHLVRCISGGDIHPSACGDEVDSDETRWGFRPRTMSISGASPSDIPLLQEEPQPDYKELTSIPLLPMYALLAADEDTTVAKNDHISAPSQTSAAANQDYSDLFSTSMGQDEELNIDVLGTSADSNRSGPRQRLPSSSAQVKNPNYFGPGYSQILTKHLTHTRLPGLSSLDQMYLLAIGDTVANIKMDFADRFEGEKSDIHVSDGSTAVNQVSETIDDCGLRFLLAIRHHIYLLRTLPPRQRAVLKKQGLKSFNLVWAFHSEATEELLSYLPNMQKGEPTWEELHQFGAGWWIRSISLLKKTIEKLAKVAFQAKKDPMDAAIFYLAMRKKNVLWGLYRSIGNKKMMDFFKHDFKEERWRKAALKNAFDLLGKQRFAHAAAFFLLAGSLNDAVEVCLDKLDDMQLALVICRLYDGEDIMSESAKKILRKVILGQGENGNNSTNSKPHPDPFLRSMALWLFKDYKKSLKTLLQSGTTGNMHNNSNGIDSNGTTPSVFNFFNYLRTHPLLVRQRIIKAAPSVANRRKVIPGFTRQNTVVESNENTIFIDKVTPMERRLFFKTAHTHYKNGCPLLALEVLSKLPSIICEEDADDEDTEIDGLKSNEGCISTGRLNDFDKNAGNSTLSNNSSELGFDWGQPMTNGFTQTNAVDSFDWGAPISRLEDEEPRFELSASESEDGEEEEKTVSFSSQKDKKGILEKVPPIVIDDTDSSEVTADTSGIGKHNHTRNADSRVQVDIFAQQYMFISCLKVLMEEMRTLATGFEVDGGQLRFQLYIWLEREVEVLRYLCHYSEDEVCRDDMEQPLTSEGDLESNVDESSSYLDVTPQSRVQRSLSVRSDTSVGSYKPTLHEVILAEKMDFEAKMERMSKRKQWLKTHNQLLRTLASYCVLQGSGGGGLASVLMELLLLLQEHQQEKPQQQLLSPLPFPTTLPLLSASIASSKTVVADPIQHISCMAQDLLHSIIEVTSPPDVTSSVNTVLVMRNLSLALSACVYQCLCDCDSFVVSLNEGSDVMLEGFTSHNFTSAQAGHLMAGVQRYRRKSSAGEDIINTPPVKWPGVTSLRVLLAREKDEDAPKLHILLCETLVAVYVSLLVNAMSMYDCHMLYRLVSHKFEQQMWAALFGGGVKTVLKVANSSLPQRGDDMAKQRMKLNMRVMGSGGATSKEKKTYKETFVPPELSMITFFMTKPFASLDGGFSYDSEESLSSEDEEEIDSDSEDKRPTSLPLSAVQQHTDPTSYAWCLIRFAVVKLVLHNLNTFLPLVGIELPELPVCSPLMHAVLKTLEQWKEVLQGKLELFSGPPEEFIAGLQLDVVNGMPTSKFHALLSPSNSPFIDAHSTLPIKRLWFHLIKQEPLKEVFIRYIFRKKRLQTDSSRESSANFDSLDNNTRYKEPMKVVHKEQDIITAFALNQANTNCLSLSTQKEIVELDIGPLLNPPTWLEDENEMDIEYIKNPNPSSSSDTSDFIVVQTPVENTHSGMSSSASSPMTGMSTPTHSPYQTGRGTNVILRRPVAGVRRIGSHPTLPHYLTGSADGSVRLYEWGHIQPLAMLRQPGAFPKVTKVLFSSQGNKCCVSDTEGDICLWQVGMGSNFNKPIMSLKCHNKTASDFTFVGSSSLIATAGHSSESKNVCLWDMLLPSRSACVHAFTCHEHGCPALAYAPHHQLLITGGRKGEVCIFDIRQRQLRHTFQAHDVPIRCIAMDPDEEYFVTGSSEGDIKVWGLDIHQLVVNFPGEHNKTTFFRNMGSASGVTQVGIGPNHHLFSCGVDGSIKFRALPERESMVRYWTSDLK